MSTKEKKVFAEFQTLMTRLAKKNGDDFKVTMTTDIEGHHIEVIETADNHVFLDARGETIEKAVANAIRDIPDALDSWGYENVS
jgi:hypothetical protein